MPDVNVLIGALYPAAEFHLELRQWLTEALRGQEVVGLSTVVLSGVQRILTNRRIFQNPLDTRTAVRIVDELRSAPACRDILPTPGHWTTFTELCVATEATANAVPDAFHAALAINHGATFVTLNRGFAKFPGLKVVSPLATTATTD